MGEGEGAAYGDGKHEGEHEFEFTFINIRKQVLKAVSSASKKLFSAMTQHITLGP